MLLSEHLFDLSFHSRQQFRALKKRNYENSLRIEGERVGDFNATQHLKSEGGKGMESGRL